MSFSDLKKQSRLGSLTSKLTKEIEKMNKTGGSGGADERLWKLDVDKAGKMKLSRKVLLPKPEKDGDKQEG